MNLLNNDLLMKYLKVVIVVAIAINVVISVVMIKTSNNDDANNTCDSKRVGRIIGFILMATSALAIWNQYKAGSSILVPVITLIINALLVKTTYDDDRDGSCDSKTWLKYLGYLNGAQAVLIAAIYIWFTTKTSSV